MFEIKKVSTEEAVQQILNSAKSLLIVKNTLGGGGDSDSKTV